MSRQLELFAEEAAGLQGGIRVPGLRFVISLTTSKSGIQFFFIVRSFNLLNIFASFCCLLKTETKCAGCFLLKLTPAIRRIKYHSHHGEDLVDHEEEEES